MKSNSKPQRTLVEYVECIIDLLVSVSSSVKEPQESSVVRWLFNSDEVMNIDNAWLIGNECMTHSNIQRYDEMLNDFFANIDANKWGDLLRALNGNVASQNIAQKMFEYYKTGKKNFFTSELNSIINTIKFNQAKGRTMLANRVGEYEYKMHNTQGVKKVVPAVGYAMKKLKLRMILAENIH